MKNTMSRLKNCSGLLQTVSAISGVMVTLIAFLGGTGRATNPSLLWQLKVWLTYRLFVQERAGAECSYWICFDCGWHWPETQRDEVEAERRRTEVRGISINLILQCLGVFKIYCNSFKGTQCLRVVFCRPPFKLACLYPVATQNLCVM